MTNDKIMARYWLEDPEFGKIIITVRPQARSFIARWKEESLHLTVPMGASEKEIISSIDTMRPRLHKRKKPKLVYHEGQIITCFRHAITLGTQDKRPGAIGFGGDGEELFINLPKGADFSTQKATHTISACLEKLMATRAESTLIPFAMEKASELGVNPAGYEIGRGKRKLGHCTNKKIIQLSRTLMFYPHELVEMVICHEFAHLTHMNHSDKFHALCNRYLNGREAHLERLLKKFTLPIIK